MAEKTIINYLEVIKEPIDDLIDFFDKINYGHVPSSNFIERTKKASEIIYKPFEIEKVLALIETIEGSS